MSKDSYPRFLRSQIYKGVLSAAQQQGSRRLDGEILSSLWRKSEQTHPLTSKGHLQHKISGSTNMSRDDNSHTSLPKQLSSDSLPLKAAQLPAPVPPHQPNAAQTGAGFLLRLHPQQQWPAA
uniref:RGS domain-containing protein n=1 Tax=Ditylenchus dipsaci TaxID=166011 RepID=A0A915E751_9BILA